MKQFLLTVQLVLVLINSAFGQEKIHIGVFYESLCPDSIRFIKNQLEPVYPHFAEQVEIDFIPFGKSRSYDEGERYEFSCQHGPDECSGNKLHSCGLLSAKTQASKVDFVTCQMSYGSEGSDLCAEQAGLPYNEILECYSSELSTKLQLDAESKTKRLAAPREMLGFVPTIVFNHKYDPLKQERALVEFRKILCEEIQLVSNELPSICHRI